MNGSGPAPGELIASYPSQDPSDWETTKYKHQEKSAVQTNGAQDADMTV